MKKSQVRYRYALNEKNELLEIHTAHELGGVYYCPQCGQQMICKCGTKKAWHFAHEKIECDYNHYLHSIAEQRISEWFNDANEIPMAFQINEVCGELCKFYNAWFCSKSCLSETFNLKDYYCDCKREMRYEKNGHTFIADILCYPKHENHEPLFIEICVTHPCEPEKLNSEIKIIEFVITSEEDIDMIIDNRIESSDKVRLYNFHPKDKYSSSHTFENELQKFILFPSGKGYVDTIHCSGLNNRRGKLEITIPYNAYEPEFLGDGGFFSIAYAVAFQTDKSLRHCCLCKYHAYDVWDGFGICKLYKKIGTNKDSSRNDAHQCPYFRVDDKSIQLRIKEFDDYCFRNSVDIWMKQKD